MVTYIIFINSWEERICVIKCYTLKILIYSIQKRVRNWIRDKSRLEAPLYEMPTLIGQ